MRRLNLLWGEKAIAELDPNFAVDAPDKSTVEIIKKNTLQFENGLLLHLFLKIKRNTFKLPN